MVTPAKNEENNLPNLIRSVANQRIRPVVWVIVDDGSDDYTPLLIDRAASKFPWIHCLKLKSRGEYDIEEHYAVICRKGFKYALDYCKQNKIRFEYIALCDADMIYPRSYFYQLLLFLSANSDFGIVSGKILIMSKSGELYTERNDYFDHPRGPGRVWRKETFEETNGYIKTKSPDSVSNIMALLKGWKIKQLPEVIGYQTRDTGGKRGLWNGFSNRGKRAYYLSANPLSVLNVLIDLILISKEKNSILKSVAYFLGYFKSFVQRDAQFENDEVRKYIGSYKRVIRQIRLFLRKYNSLLSENIQL